MRKTVLWILMVTVLCWTAWPGQAGANGNAGEVEALKGEIQELQEKEQQMREQMQRLMNRLEELEKRQAADETHAVQTEQKLVEVEEKAGKGGTSLKDRINWGGEIRFRILNADAFTDRGFYGGGSPGSSKKWRDETSFPFRIRLNGHVEVIPDLVDVYARLTMNKRWGAWSSMPTDPFNKPNSFESSIGHDMDARFEQAYMTMKIPSLNSTWYVGRLPGMDGAPVRQARALFPRLFIDSEIDGTLWKWDAPETGLDRTSMPWTTGRLWGDKSGQENSPVLKSYRSKVKDKSGIILGYLKYQENKLEETEDKEERADSDAFLAQAQVKIGKETEVIVDGLIMQDWHMPNTSEVGYVPALNTDYHLAGAYLDTQLLGLQLYGAYYYSHFEIPGHSFSPGGTEPVKMVKTKGYDGHMWFAGFNTGDLITRNQQLTVEFADGSDAWINPFNYRGFRRKGTVLSPAGNSFYDPSGKSTVGFYPFNAQVWDIYYDYYYHPKVRFRLGYLDFLYTKHDRHPGQSVSILGSSKYQHVYWPYFEVNVSF